MTKCTQDCCQLSLGKAHSQSDFLRIRPPVYVILSPMEDENDSCPQLRRWSGPRPADKSITSESWKLGLYAFFSRYSTTKTEKSRPKCNIFHLAMGLCGTYLATILRKRVWHSRDLDWFSITKPTSTSPLQSLLFSPRCNFIPVCTEGLILLGDGSKDLGELHRIWVLQTCFY